MSVKDTDLGFKRITAALTEFQELDIFIGFQGIHGEVAAIAAHHEFGTENIEARPFLSSALEQGQERIGKALDAAFDTLIKGTDTAIGAAEKLGLLGVLLVKQRILSSPEWAKELDKKTIAAKGSTKPLVDTARMLNSVTYVVKRGETMVAQG